MATKVYGSTSPLTKLTIIILLVSSIIASACAGAQLPLDGQVYALQVGSTVWGIRAAIAEKAGTMIMTKDSGIMFMWSVSDGWAFAVIDGNRQAAIETLRDIVKNGGNFVNPKTMSDLVSYMKDNGWEISGASQLPRAIKIAANIGSSWLVQLAQSMTTFVVLPAGSVWDSDTIQKYQNAPVKQ